jgi:hypothetical protein
MSLARTRVPQLAYSLNGVGTRYPGGVGEPRPTGGWRKDGWVLVVDAAGH